MRQSTVGHPVAYLLPHFQAAYAAVHNTALYGSAFKDFQAAYAAVHAETERTKDYLLFQAAYAAVH